MKIVKAICDLICFTFSAECVKDRTDVQCLHRWQKVLNPELVKGPWSKEVGGEIALYALLNFCMLGDLMTSYFFFHIFKGG